MVTLHPEFVIGEDKRTKAVILPFPEWEKVVDELEELDDIRAFDAAKSSAEKSIPFNQAVREIHDNYDA